MCVNSIIMATYVHVTHHQVDWMGLFSDNVDKKLVSSENVFVVSFWSRQNSVIESKSGLKLLFLSWN